MGNVLDKNSALVRKRIESHSFDDEEGDEYEASAFNGFGDYFRRKKIKLQNLDADIRATSDKPQIFKGIVAHITGYTQPPLHILHRQIVEHGGGFLQYLDSKTMATHIIASSLPPKKTVDFSRYRIVKPTWITESIAAGKLLPWADYRVLDEGPRQKVLKFGEAGSLTQSSPAARQGYREQTNNSYYTAQFRNAESQPDLDADDADLKADAPELEEGIQGAGLQDNDMDHVNEPDDLQLENEDEIDQSHVVPKPETSLPVPTKEMTSEEHNAWLLSDPRLRESSSANPEFLNRFYSTSRLHHLSTWKAELKSSMQKLAAEKGLAVKTYKSHPGSRRYILHVDFDSFFCAVSLKNHPEYREQPAVVAHGSGNGSEIASCNYIAREFGVKNGMWMKQARDLCSDVKVMPYDFPAYEEASRLFYESIMDIGGVVQSVSIDEALVDATGIVLHATGSQGTGVDESSLMRERDKADDIGKTLRKTIKDRTGCEVSVGIGANILQAKVALRQAKPAGQFQLTPDNVLDVIGELKVEQLPGVAYSLSRKLDEIGVKLVRDLRNLSKERLISALGPKTGERLSEYARGIDKTEVGVQPPRKSVSAEVSWGIRFISQPEAEEFVYNLCKELERRLLNEQVKGRQLTVKIMRRSLDAPLDPAKHLGHGRCDTFNKSATFGVSTHSHEIIGKEAVAVLRSYKFSPGDLRGLGVQMTKLEPIKGSSAAESSQKKLSFAAFAGPSSAKKRTVAEKIDEGDVPTPGKSARGFETVDDPIADDPLTPKKPKVHPAMLLTKAAEKDAKAQSPLNVSGTQFIMPSNADPRVMAELPNDIRSRLMAQKARTPKSTNRSPSPFVAARSESPGLADVLPSQVDAEVFNALPEDMKAEILKDYGRQTERLPIHQSPSKRHLSPHKKPTTPTKRGGIRGMMSKAQKQKDAEAGVVQTSFMTAGPSEGDQPTELEIEELDAEFLAELPEDVRKEVIADHRRQMLAQRSGLDAPATRRARDTSENALDIGQRTISFPAAPPKISFATSGATSTQEMKDLLAAWHTETREDGPHRGDVEVLETYLQRVVTEEKDMNKAATIVKWLTVLVHQDTPEGKGLELWQASLQGIRDVVQDAVKRRGLARLNI